MAESLGISFQALSRFGGEPAEEEVKQILGIADYMSIGYAIRLGYPASWSARYLRVRRDVEAFAHHNRYGNSGIE
jgi:hypothetical protein